VFFENARDAEFKPQVEEKGMARLRSDYDRRNIVAEDEILIVRSVENEDEVVLGMRRGDALEGFIGEPADPLEAVF
jgi:hypothetical protein